MTKDAHKAYPDHPVIGALLVLVLLPVSTENAEELIRHIGALATRRQLALEEAATLGEAYFVLRRYAEAEIIFRGAAKRFPDVPEFIMHLAYALHEQGRDEDAFLVLNALLLRGKHSFAVYSNLGHLARITGRLDDAIRLFELAAGRTTDPSDRAELHCLLYELHKRRGDAIKEQLWHAVQYGKVCGADPESEARYLIMFFIATLSLNSTDDTELKTWISEFQGRLKKFSSNYPRFHSLMTLRAPEGLSQSDAAYYLFTEIASLMLPIHLVRSSLAIRMREGLWPLPTRAELLGASSLCQYWQHCTGSSDPEHAIYIFSSPLEFGPEVQSVSLRSVVCVDLTTILTLKLLNLLDEVLGVFECWVIAAGTREALEDDSTAIGAPQAVATELRDWLIENRSRIRTRKLTGRRRQERGREDYRLESGIWIRNETMMYDLVGKGVGETLLLARQLDLPLYSDEAAIRLWGAQQYGVGFSTVSLLRRLRNESRLSLANKTACVVRLITSNYRYIPFGHEHLQQGSRSSYGISRIQPQLIWPAMDCLGLSSRNSAS